MTLQYSVSVGWGEVGGLCDCFKSSQCHRRRSQRGGGGGGEGHMPLQILRLGGHGGGTCIFEPHPHTTCVRLCDQVVQIMASQRILDTWLPAAKKKKTLFDKR